MRVISGILKGRNIKGHNILGTRPTMDRVKESIFSMIQDNIKDAYVLDLFAGSGNLGIEAISNGAKKVYFIDNNIKAINIIKDNIKTLNIIDKSIIIKNDYLKALEKLSSNNLKFDLIFLDPPYNLNVIEDILKLIKTYNLLNDNGLVIAEYSKYIPNNEEYLLIKEKKYGDTFVHIYKLNKDIK